MRSAAEAGSFGAMDKADEKQVKAVVHRCPFCHEGAEAEGSVACQGCLARHHEACWSESGRCASCGSERALAPTPRPALTVELVSATLRARGYPAAEIDDFLATSRAPHTHRDPGRTLLAIVATLVAAVMLVGGIGAYVTKSADHRRARDAMHVLERQLEDQRNMSFERQRQAEDNQRTVNDLLLRATLLESEHTAALTKVREAEERLRSAQDDNDEASLAQEQLWAAQEQVKKLERERSLHQQELERATRELR
jgi:hypothetical protein